MTANIVPEITYSDTQLNHEVDEQTHRRSTPRNKNMLSLPLNNSNSTLSTGRPKLHTFRSSDASRFPTLEKLEGTVLPSKSSKITVEPVTFPGESNNSTISNSKKFGSQSDVKSIHSVKSTKKKQKIKKYQSTPSEIFAQNLSEAVLDVDDSLDDGYVYNNSNGTFNLYPPLLSPTLLSSYEAPTNNYKSGNKENYFSDHNHQKYRRPGLRSTVSELPARGVKSFYLDCMAMPPKFEKRSSYNNKGYHYSRYRYSSSGEEDEENAPLLYYSSSGKKGRNRSMKLQNTRRKRSIWCKWLAVLSIVCSTLFCSLLLFLASPLKEIEVSYISNVLGTRKQLILDLHIQATNPNSWSVQISHSAFSVFAASHYVPTIYANNNNANNLRNQSEEAYLLPTANQEYLGTVTRLEDPLLFGPANLFYLSPKSSNSTSQVQIQNPGETNGDAAGNERWSLLIRYPYELTIRGVLKYRIFPSVLNPKVYSARICKVVQVDPATGAVDDVPLLEQSVCEDS